MKSFDDLIRYLLDEIALCGEQGAQLSNVIDYIKSFYTKSPYPNPNSDSGANQGDSSRNVAIVDHSFQEQVWKWLVASPDCRVVVRGEKNSLSLSDGEAANCFPPPPNTQIPNFSSGGQNGFTKQPTDINPQPERSKYTISNMGNCSEPVQRQEPTYSSRQLSKFTQEIRVYANVDRMWHALTGHGVDFSKIPQLDFVCLSVIAAAGPEGILQAEIVRISNQDKRSVPRRTQNLHNRGYIIKRPILAGGARTSLCLLKRFAQTSSNEETKNELLDDHPPPPGNKSESIFKQCFQDGKADLCALSRAIFDILGDLKIIMIDDLKANLGVIGRRWERRIVAMTLRKLEALGCVKQVKAPADMMGFAPKYFRCIKLIREPNERDSQLLFGLANVNMRPISNEVVDDLDSEGDSAEDDRREQLPGYRSADDSLRPRKTQELELERHIPQWSGTGCINNNIYDLVHRSGTDGISSMDIKNRLLGKYVSKPMEHQLSRIVDFWQISQPPHLRHLAVLRDLAMINRSTFYIHFSYDNFKKLVESGEASWEAVTTLGKNDKKGKDPLDDEPDVDEYGFPKLQNTLFQGRYNDATLAQCVQALDAKPLLPVKNDPVAYKLDDGTYVIRGFPGRRKAEPLTHDPKILNEMPRTPRSRGRPRKVGSTQLAKKTNLDENRRRTKSQKNELQYQRTTLGDETSKRIYECEDLDDVLQDKSISLAIGCAEVAEKIAPISKYITYPEDRVVENQDIGMSPSPSTRKRRRCSSYPTQNDEPIIEYAPSVIAHTRPILHSSNLSVGSTSLDRRRATKCPLDEPRVEDELTVASKPFDSIEYQNLPSVAAHKINVFDKSDSLLSHYVSNIKRTRRRPSKKLRFDEELTKVSHVGKLNKYQELTYTDQSDLIKRTGYGCFLGNIALRARSKGQRGRTPNCRLAIFKSTRLSRFEWFTKIESPSQDQPHLITWDETIIFPSLKNPTISKIEASRGPFPILGSPHSSLEPDPFINGPDPNYISPYLNSYTDERKGIEIINEGVSEKFSQSILISSKIGAVASSKDSGHPTSSSSENISTPQNDETYTSYLGPPPAISSFTPINHHTLSNLPNDETTICSPGAESYENEYSAPSPSSDTPEPPTLDDVDPSMRDLDLSSYELKPMAENTLEITNDDCLPAADLSSPSNSGTRLPNNTLESKSEKRLSRKVQSVSTTRGSIGVLRRNIIMDIMNTCGGVFPDHKTLVAPFVTAWMKLNKPGKPDGKTVHAAYRSLINSGKLRELVFSFQDSHGLVVTKSIITTIEIDPTDARVTKIQENIIACYPQYFIPEEVEIFEEVRQRSHFPSKWIMHRYSADLEVDDGMQVRRQHKPKYLVQLENRRAAIENNRKLGVAGEKIKATRKPKKPIRRELFGDDNIETLHHQRRAGPFLEHTRRVERLASIRRSTNRDVLNLKMPPMDGVPDSYDECLNWGSSAQMDFESANVVPLSEADKFILNNGEDTIPIPRIRRRRYSEFLELSQSATTSFVRHTKRRKIADSYYKDLRQRSTIMNPKHIFHPSSGTFSATFSGLESPQRGLISMPRKRQDKGLRAKTSYATPGHSTIMNPAHVFHIASGTFSVTFSGFEPLPRRQPSTLRRHLGKGNNTRSTMQQTLMNHKQEFYPLSGTFSTIFTGFEFQRQDSGNKSHKGHDEKPRTALETEIDDIISWGRMTKSYLSSDYSNWPFINYGMKYYQVSNQVECTLGRGFQMPLPDINGLELNKADGFLVFPSMLKRSTKKTEGFSLQASKKVEAISIEASKKPNKRKGPTKRLEFKTRPLTALAIIDKIETQNGDDLADECNDDSRLTKVRRIRGPQRQTPMTSNEEERLLAAVIVIRTLVGGVDKNVDWVLVARLFQPTFGQMYIQKRWRQVLYRFRLQIDQVQANFQSQFTKAYEDGVIPTIDFDNIEEYDWTWLVDWTMENIDTSTDSLKGLPARRRDLDEIFDLRATSDNEMPEFYEIDSAAVYQRREVVLNRRSYVYPAETQSQTSSQAKADGVAIAKTWIRANVVTSEASYDSKLARTKLSSVGESSIDIALQELLVARLLAQQNKGRLIPGRNYDISDFFLSRMRKRLDASQFYRAAAFKQKLDSELLANGSAEFSYTAENGHSLAVLNMLAHQRISVKPKNPPMEKFGLLDKGYQTRRMDKSRLNFDVEIRMERNYIMGNPLSPLQPPPSQHLADPMAKIPVWYDIHDNFIPIMWEMALAATMVILAMRPGVNALEIEKSVRPSLGSWELDVILEWMVRAKAATKTGSGYMVDEWWWMCLGDGQIPNTAEMDVDATHDSQYIEVSHKANAEVL